MEKKQLLKEIKKIGIKKECKGYGTFAIYPAEQEWNMGRDFVIWLNDKRVLPVGEVVIKEKKKLLIINGNEYNLKVLDTEKFFGEVEAVKWEAEIKQKDYKLLTEQDLKETIKGRERTIKRISKHVYLDSLEKMFDNLELLREKLRVLSSERQLNDSPRRTG